MPKEPRKVHDMTAALSLTNIFAGGNLTKKYILIIISGSYTHKLQITQGHGFIRKITVFSNHHYR
jgi:hypothetical protein